MITLLHVRKDQEAAHLEENHMTVLEHEFIFGLVTYGKCVYWVRDKKMVLTKGDAILIPKGVPFYWKSIPTVLHAKITTTFRVLTEISCLPFLMTDQHTHAKLGCFDLIHGKMKLLTDQWNEKLPYHECLGSALLTEILILWQRELEAGNISSEKHKLVAIMKNYIKEQYRTKISKENLGDAIRRSPNHAAALFSSVTGQTISEYTHAIRTKTALYLLQESELTIGEIALFLGYSDVSYFNKIFKRSTGKPPSEFLSERPRKL